MSIFDALSRYKLLIEIAVIGSLAGGAIYGIHQFLEHERDIGRKEVQAQWDAQKLSDKTASDKQEKDWREKYDTAVNLGVENVKIARASAVTANASADSLRNTNASIVKLIPGASAETARAYATAYQTVFNECVGRYKEVGERAQGHADDVKTLEAAWPVNRPTEIRN